MELRWPELLEPWIAKELPHFSIEIYDQSMRSSSGWCGFIHCSHHLNAWASGYIPSVARIEADKLWLVSPNKKVYTADHSCPDREREVQCYCGETPISIYDSASFGRLKEILQEHHDKLLESNGWKGIKEC